MNHKPLSQSHLACILGQSDPSPSVRMTPPKVTYQIRSAERLVVHTAEPGYTVDSIIESFLARLADPAYVATMAVIWHFLPGCNALGLNENSRLHSMAGQIKGREQPWRVALVGADEELFGSLRQFAGLTPSSAAIHNVFRDMQSALDWVQLPIDPEP